MTLKKNLAALAAVAAVVAGLATAPAYAGPVVSTFQCNVNDVWTLPGVDYADACLTGLEKNITTSGSKGYLTNATLATWSPYTTGSWTLVTDDLTSGGLWDSLLALQPGQTVDLIVFLKQSAKWGAYYFDDVKETLGGYDTQGYEGDGSVLSHGFVLAGDRKTTTITVVPPPEEVPEPTTLLLLGSALLGLGLRGRRSSKA